MNILNSPSSIDFKVIEALEQYWEFSLTKDYKLFLSKYNGGSPDFNYFSFKQNSDNGSFVDNFFGICKDKNNNLLVNMKLYNNRIPSNFLPIADDPGSNLILLSVKGLDRGKVYFWDHNFEVEDGVTPDYSNLTLIADSFDEFIHSLKSDDEIKT